MISNLLPTEATHSSLDLFEKSLLLVKIEKAFTQKSGLSYSPDGHMLEFEVLGNRNNFIDLQRNCLEILTRIVENHGQVMWTHATEAAQRDTPYLVNNPVSSFFPNAQCLWVEKKLQQLMPILPIRVSFRPNIEMIMMQRKHGLLVKVIIMKIIHQVLMVLMAIWRCRGT